MCRVKFAVFTNKSGAQIQNSTVVCSSTMEEDEVLSLSSLIEGDVDAVDSDVDLEVARNELEDAEEPELLAISQQDDAKSEGKTPCLLWTVIERKLRALKKKIPFWHVFSGRAKRHFCILLERVLFP